MATTAQRPSASPVESHAAPTAETANRSGKATAAFIVGIVSVLAFVIPILGLILAIVAISLGTAARSEMKRTRKTNLWMANAGLGLGLLAVVASVGIFVVALAGS